MGVMVLFGRKEGDGRWKGVADGLELLGDKNLGISIENS